MKKLALLLILIAASAHAQLQRFDYFASTTTGTGSLIPLLVIPGAGIKFYSCSGAASTTCTTLLTTYTDITGGTSCPTTAQVVQLTTSTCVSTADVQGNFGIWVPASGTFGYAYTITVSGTTFGKYQFTVGGGGSGSGCSQGTCVVNAPIGSQTVNQTTGTLASNSINNVISIVTGTAIDTLPAAIIACGSSNTTIQITQTLAVGSGITVPRNCPLLFQSAGNLTGTSITINGAVISSPVQIFGAGLAVTGLSGSARPEWWGVVPYSTVALAAAGSNDVTKAQAVFTALTGGGYMELACAYYHIGGLVITANSQGIVGDCPWGVDASGFSVTNHVSTIVDTSASETILDAHGSSPSALLGNLTLKNFAVQRTVLPTGTARGISLDHLVTPIIDNVTSADSIDLLYAHNAGNNGLIHHFFGIWGVSSVSGASYVSGTPHAINLDSSDGVGEDTLNITDSIVDCSQIPSVVSTGLFNNGTNVSDVKTDHVSTGSCSHGIDTENTGTSALVGQDVQYLNSVLNACGIDCMKINGVESTPDIGPHVYVQGGNFFPVGTSSFGILVHNSTNIGISGTQILSGGLGVTDISLNAVDGFTVTNTTIDDLDSGASDGISCLNSTHGTIGNNQIKKYSSGTGIKNVGCTKVSEQGNSIAANAGGTLGTGISFDSGSSNNGPWSLNNIDTSNVTTPVSDAGTGNNTLSPSIFVLNGGTPLTGQSAAQSQIVTCATGGTGSQFCGADGAWHSAAGAGTVTSVGTSSPLSGGPITSSGTISCPTCVTSAAALTNNAVVIGGGLQASSTIGADTTTTHALFATAGAPAFRAIVSGDIPTLNQNTTGTAANLSGTPALPNGTTATTQSTADSTTKLATDAYVQANVTALGTVYAPLTNPSVGQNNYAPIASPTFTGTATTPNLTVTANGAASTPAVSLTGTPFVGTGTTSTPLVYANGGSAPTTWAAAGTYFGANAVSGFNGDFFAFHLNGGTPLARLDNTGALTVAQCTGCVPASANVLASSVGSQAIAATGHNIVVPLTCADTSGSGTAQTCTTAPSFTPVANDCVIYTTTTANTGTGLTLNVNSLGAKSVAKWLGATTLAANDVLAGQAQIACYNGTVWNLSTIGNAPSGGGTGISGATAGQALIAGSPTTATSSKALAGTATGIVTGPTSNTTGDFPVYVSTNGGTSDSGFTAADIGRLSQVNSWAQINSFVGVQGGTGSGGSLTDGFTCYNSGNTNGSACGLNFQGRNSAFGTFKGGEIFMTMTTNTSTAEVTTMTFNYWNAGAAKTGLVLSAARKGTFVCTAAGTITISNTNEAATSDVIISLNTAGGTISTAPAMKTVTAGTGFTVLCGAADTSTYNYNILN